MTWTRLEIAEKKKGDMERFKDDLEAEIKNPQNKWKKPPKIVWKRTEWAVTGGGFERKGGEGGGLSA